MKLTKKLLAASVALAASLSLSAQTTYTIDDAKKTLDDAGVTFEFVDNLVTGREAIRAGLDSFGKTLLTAAPQASASQNLWADAYIGNLLSIPPHFGFGFTVGGTKLDMSGFKDAAKSFGKATNLKFGDIPSNLFLPILSVDARIGGVVLPFDVGFSLMMTSPALFDMDLKDADSILGSSGGISFDALGFDGKISYLTLGLDARYALLKGGLIAPKVSVGAGYVYTRGQFGASASKGDTEGNIEMAYTTHVLFLEAQASKSFLLFTVFGGSKILLSNTTTAWAYDITTTINGTTTSLDGSKIKDTQKGSRTADGKSDKLKSGSFDFSGIQPLFYAGVSLNFFVFQTSLSAGCDLRSFFDDSYDSSLWSGTLSFHFKL